MADHESTSTRLGTGIAFLVLANAAVALRLYSKTFTKAKFAADDWLICLSLICLYAWVGVLCWGMYSGGGPEMIQKYTYILTPIFGLTITTCKLSILGIYVHIFGSIKRFRRICLVTAVLCGLWWLIYTTVTLNPCRPIKKFWQPVTPGTCYDFNEFILGVTLVDIILDIAILLLPIEPILHLQMSRNQKWLVCSIFLVGGFVIITGIVRLKLIYVPHATSFDSEIAIQCGIWSNIHLGTAILCACLPTCRPAMKSLGSRLNSLFGIHQSSETLSSVGVGSTGTYSKTSNRSNLSNRQFPLPYSGAGEHQLRKADVTHTSRGESFEKMVDETRNHIKVESTVEIV